MPEEHNPDQQDRRSRYFSIRKAVHYTKHGYRKYRDYLGKPKYQIALLTLVAVIFYTYVTWSLLVTTQINATQQHDDTMDVLKRNDWNASLQHADTVIALTGNDIANMIAQDAADKQLRAMQAQQQTMQGQLQEMIATRKNEEAQLAAQIAYTDPVMWPMDAQHRPVAKDSPNIALWSVSPGWRDVGITAAESFASGYDLAIKPRDLSQDIHVIYKTCPARPKLAKPAIRLLPTDPRVELGKDLSLDDAERAQRGLEAIFFVLNASYRDIFQKPGDVPHHYYVCVMIGVLDAKNSAFSFLQVDRKSD